MNAQLIFWEVLCLALFYSVFCRSVRTDTTTRLDVRIAIFLMGLSSLVGMGAPLYNWLPDTVSLIMLSATVLMQIVSSSRWRGAVPYQFIDSRFLPRGRRQGERT